MTSAHDRRTHPRRDRAATTWGPAVLVRPGRHAILLDISESGALIEIESPLRPGATVHLQLSAHDERLGVSGRVARCYVASLTSDTGVRYHGAIAFDTPLPARHGRSPRARSGESAGEYSIPRAGTSHKREHGQSLPVLLQPANR